MCSRNNRRLGGILLILASALFAQPQLPAPATGNGSLAGVVINSATGAPVSRARVTVIIFGSPGTQVFNTVTDAEGKFLIGSLPPGQININADRVGFVPPPGGNRLSNPQLKPDEKRENLKLTLMPTGSVSGRVLNAEGPVQGAIVSLDGAAFGVTSATTNEKGQYRISRVPPGRYRVLANPAVMPFPAEIRTDGSREVHYARTYYPDGLTVKDGQRVEVGGGAEVTGVDIRLVRTPVVSLTGKVLDAPAGGKTVVRAIAGAATGGGTQFAPSVKADGSFQFWQLDPGKYTLIAANTPQGLGPARGLQSAPVEVEVAGADLDHVELRMIAPFDLTVQLAFADATAREVPMTQPRPGPGPQPSAQNAPRQPLPRRVMVRPEDQMFVNSGQGVFQPIEISAADTFALESLLPMRYRVMPSWGVYVASVRIGNVESEGDLLDLRDGPSGPVTVTMGSTAGEISGVVSDSSGPAGSVAVVLLSARSMERTPRFSASAPDGAYKFTGVPPGKYKLIAADNDIIQQFQTGRDIGEYADILESIEVYAGDKATKALKKFVPGAR